MDQAASGENNNLHQLVQKAQEVLKTNDRGRWTVPAVGFYPHQWLWDSCFIAIGLRHSDPRRAAVEIESLFRGQWQNGMLPHITMSEPSDIYWEPPELWESHISPAAPNMPTSGITQPPLPAIAALSVAEKLSEAEAEVFLNRLYPKLLEYHQWIYRDRVPDGHSLAVLVSPLETGMDNTPPWVVLLKKMSALWVTVLIKLGLASLLTKLRNDIRATKADQRATNIEVFKYTYLTYLHKKNRYDSRVTIAKSRFTMESLSFNSILIAANRALSVIAKKIHEDLPSELSYRFKQTEPALEELWSEVDRQYYQRQYKTGRIIKVASIATFLPLFAGSISPERAGRLVQLLKDHETYWPAYPVPTTPLNSRFFDADRYWRGPTWINTNWMIIQGLRNYGFNAEADQLRQTCLDLVTKSGFYEYFSSLDGSGLGVDNFSWTAALFIDLINSKG